MDRQRARVGEPRYLEDARGQLGPEVLRLAGEYLLELGPRHRADGFETAQVGKALVGREQAVKPRGTRPHRADDNHRVLERAGEDFRVPLEPHLRVEPVAQHVVKHLRGGKFARRVELRFVLHAVEQHLEGLFEPAVAEIVEPRGRCRFFQQGILVEARRAEHPQLASAPDRPVRNIDKARAARRLDRLVVQAGSPFKLFDVPLNVRGLMRCPQKDKLAPREVAGQAGSEKA